MIRPWLPSSSRPRASLALGVAVAILRSFGPRYRVGRLLAAAPRVPVAEAVRLAEAGEARYVRIDGRIDSDAEFEDADHRPLVLRRTRIEWRPAAGAGGHGATTSATPDRRSRGALRRSRGPRRDRRRRRGARRGPHRRPADQLGAGRATWASGARRTSRPDADARLDRRAGLQRGARDRARRADGASRVAGPVIGAGLGRPLILTTLERDEAMRVLTGGARRAGRGSPSPAWPSGAVLIAAAALWWLLEALVGGGVATALAASPDPTLRPGADTRTSGGGPGLVGEPLLAILGVLAHRASLSAAATLAWVR